MDFGLDDPVRIVPSDATASPTVPVALIPPARTVACCWVAVWRIAPAVGSGEGKALISGLERKT